MHAHIIYYNYLKPDGNGMSIGGIQTYITNLIPILKECGYSVSVYQRANLDFHKKNDDCDIYGVAHQEHVGINVARAILSKVLSKLDKTNDLLIYGCETCITQKVDCRTIAIQHGISWDIPYETCSPIRYLRHFIGKFRMAWVTSNRVNKVDTLVCVDYNFLNWHRAVSPYIRSKHTVIPNFSEIPTVCPVKNNEMINIIFARRLFPHRGTRLITSVVKRVFATHHNVRFTIAGDGPDANYMHQELDSYENVRFITYASNESLKIHEDEDIAIIPTIGSEGTSLSLLEAMASGCAVVCTNVGGMTNIVLDGYNGIMTSPDENSIYKGLTQLIQQPALLATIQNNAYNTVKEAFSLAKWTEKWREVIKNAY